MTRLRVLFVDDEPMVLAGLRNAFRRERDRWDMRFVTSGAAALDALAAEPCDVLVTDMRMPGMDGGDLLLKVREAHPAAMRIVLSGDAERDAAVRALSAAHQYLSKPCESGILKAAIDRATVLAPLLADPALRQVVGGLDRLPSLPRSYAALTQAIASPTASIGAIAQIVATDSAMTVKILQVANSAYFGHANQKTTLESAVAFLGLDLLKALALSAHVFMAVEGDPVAGFSIKQFQRVSTLAARVAHRIAPDRAPADQAFTAALVHDIGQVVMAVGMKARYAEVLWLERDGGLPLHAAEREILGVAHPAVGAYLLGVWGLPIGIVDLTARHHDAFGPGVEIPSLLPVVQVATALAGEILSGEAARCAGPLDPALVAALGPGADLENLRALARAEAETLADAAERPA